MDNHSKLPGGFPQRQLPWLIAAGMLLFYAFSLNPWITYKGIATLGKITGWDWRPQQINPLHVVLTFPIRWLPGGWQVFAANLFACLCSVATLALLARSVALLPHDRTKEQRLLESSDYSLLSSKLAWVPPVLAVLVAGLQLSFWENAVVATEEALDLLVFAYVIRCLLEYRISQRLSWITRFAFVYGLGITNNYAMLGFAPAFLVALIWIGGWAALRGPFLLRLAGGGLAGLSLYLLLPAGWCFSEIVDKSFFEILVTNLDFQWKSVISTPRYIILMISLTSVAPVLFMGIRWPASEGDTSAAGTAITELMQHVIHAVFLGAALYVSFDPPYSPRQLAVGTQKLLPFYYLGALAIGYCAGYFLIVFAPRRPAKTWQRPSALRQAINYGITAAIVLTTLGIPAALFYKNHPQISLNRAKDWQIFGAAAAASLPAGPAWILSDDPNRTYPVCAELSRRGVLDSYIIVETPTISFPHYHRYLKKRYGARWPGDLGTRGSQEVLGPGVLTQLLEPAVRAGQVWYLHPSFGYFFERFYQVPHQLAYQLMPLPADQVAGPRLGDEDIRRNDQFWTSFQPAKLVPLERTMKDREKTRKNRSALSLDYFATQYSASLFSRCLNTFGVELQKAGRLELAGAYFARALDVSPDNPAAFVNQEYNERLRQGKHEGASAPSEGTAQRLRPYGGIWDNILGFNGPFDEPNSLFIFAQVFNRGQQHRQSAQALERALELDPKMTIAKFALSETYIQCGFAEKALELIARMRSGPTPISIEEQLELTATEAWAYVAKSNVDNAETLLLRAQEKHPTAASPFSVLAQIYIALQRETNAIQVLDQQLKLQPNNLDALITLGALQAKVGDLDSALSHLNAAAALSPQNPVALFNRALILYQQNKIDAAQADYETLLKVLLRPSHLVYYGLGEIEFQKKNKKMAVAHYKKFLELAPAGTPEVEPVRRRIQQLQSGS